jgi:diguanylate cyclase (GGDEF)-like protein
MKQHKMVTFFSTMVFYSLLLSTVISLFSMHEISRAHTEESIKSMSSDIYHSISDDLTESVYISKTIANNTFMIDLLENENTMDQEGMAAQIASYLERTENTISCSWIFIVSEQTKAYYSKDGIYQIIDPENNPDDRWYKEFVESGSEYNVSIGPDNDSPDTWNVFVDARMEDEDGKLLGVCGLALELTDLEEYIRDYEERYDMDIFFLDSIGQAQIVSGSADEDTKKSIVLPTQTDVEQFTLQRKRSGLKINYTITQYIEQLDWYMVIRISNPYDFTRDYKLISFNIIIFIIVMCIAFIAVYHVSKRMEKLYSDSHHDKLTGIWNRRAYDEDLMQIRERKSLENISVVAFDVNGLKQMNDSMGHAAGDELISASAKLIQETFEPYGKCYRTGGDEFAAILDQPVENMDALAESFEETLSGWKGEYVKQIHVSYGIIRACDHADASIDELLFLADEQMYRKKREYYQRTGNDRRRGR